LSNAYRLNMLKSQKRSYTEGTVLLEDGIWLFFESDINEETDLDFYVDQEINVFKNGDWISGVLFANGVVVTPFERFHLESGDSIQLKKNILYSLEKLIDDLSDDAFVQFISTLNSLNYSIYDCIFCHNHLAFLDGETVKQGVNFINFDNEEQVCSVQHHFTYYKKQRDRFEFTLSTGKRLIIENIHS
jgi:hypothetical protein